MEEKQLTKFTGFGKERGEVFSWVARKVLHIAFGLIERCITFRERVPALIQTLKLL